MPHYGSGLRHAWPARRLPPAPRWWLLPVQVQTKLQEQLLQRRGGQQQQQQQAQQAQQLQQQEQRRRLHAAVQELLAWVEQLWGALPGFELRVLEMVLGVCRRWHWQATRGDGGKQDALPERLAAARCSLRKAAAGITKAFGIDPSSHPSLRAEQAPRWGLTSATLTGARLLGRNAKLPIAAV